MPVLSNPKYERFAQELAKGATADQAYVLAGYKEHRSNAARLSANEHIRSRVEEILSRVANKVGATLERTLQEIVRLALADIGDAVEWNGETVTLKDSKSLTPEVRAAISEVRKTKDGVAIKFHSKTSALEMLGKHLKMFTDKIEHSGGITLTISRDDAEL
jgi:phage terminase small subunit